MKNKRLFWVISLLLVGSLLLSACEALGITKPPLGEEGNPIQLLFVPSVDVDFMIASGDLIEQAFFDATGLYFEVSVPTSYAATIEEMCASLPTSSVGLNPVWLLFAAVGMFTGPSS